MDFTSDSKQSTTPAPSSVTQSSDIVLNQADLKLLDLQNEKERLISQRNLLLDEIDNYRTQLHRPKSAEDGKVLLQDLLTSINTNETHRVVTLDGNSDALLELKHKYDTLPLLNMDLRLRYIREFLYPDVDLLVEGDRITAVYCSSKQNFSVQLQLQHEDDVLTQCKVLEASGSVKWALKPLLESRNPASILLGCHEFDRIRLKVSSIIDYLLDNLADYGQIKLSRDQNSLQALRDDFKICLKLGFSVSFTSFLPSTHISSVLRKEEQYIEIEDIKVGLIEEYGVNMGLLQLCKTCLNI